jgi:hypothetical protein
MKTINENTITRFVPHRKGGHVRLELDMSTGEVSGYCTVYRPASPTPTKSPRSSRRATSRRERFARLGRTPRTAVARAASWPTSPGGAG